VHRAFAAPLARRSCFTPGPGASRPPLGSGAGLKRHHDCAACLLWRWGYGEAEFFSVAHNEAGKVISPRTIRYSLFPAVAYLGLVTVLTLGQSDQVIFGKRFAAATLLASFVTGASLMVVSACFDWRRVLSVALGLTAAICGSCVLVYSGVLGAPMDEALRLLASHLDKAFIPSLLGSGAISVAIHLFRAT
ncbi:MAG: hypothetical protein ACP5DX_14665, partial [Paracoccaceae bacterium]